MSNDTAPRTQTDAPAFRFQRPSANDVRSMMRWHRPLIALAMASVLVLAVCIVGIVVDHRTVTGLPVWDKPAKFAVSIAVYGFTTAWLIKEMPARRRVGSVLGTIISIALAGELVAILVQVVRGTASHFNFSTPFDAAVYQLMAGLVATIWLSNVVLVVLFLMQRLPDRALTSAMRWGLIVGVIGMGLAFLMVLPTPAQQADFQANGAANVIGAHTVGLADGGPGLPILGWSTVGGDLRIPHFVGMHGLQIILLLGLALAALGRRFPTLRSATTRVHLVTTFALAYLALVGILTWQALRGQSIIHPDLLTVGATAAVALATIVAWLTVLRRAGAATDRTGVR